MELRYAPSVHRANQFFVGLALIEILLVGIYLVGELLGHPTNFFDLDGEANLPAWFSSIQLFLVCQVLFLKACQPDPLNSPSRWFLLLGSVGFLFLSVDDAAQIHETMARFFSHVAWLPRFRAGYGVWIFLYLCMGLVVAAIATREFGRVWRRYRLATVLMTSGVALAILGGVVLEIISYQYLRMGATPGLYVVEVAFEEFFEMLGMSIALYGAIRLLIDEPDG